MNKTVKVLSFPTRYPGLSAAGPWVLESLFLPLLLLPYALEEHEGSLDDLTRAKASMRGQRSGVLRGLPKDAYEGCRMQVKAEVASKDLAPGWCWLSSAAHAG